MQGRDTDVKAEERKRAFTQYIRVSAGIGCLATTLGMIWNGMEFLFHKDKVMELIEIPELSESETQMVCQKLNDPLLIKFFRRQALEGSSVLLSSLRPVNRDIVTHETMIERQRIIVNIYQSLLDLAQIGADLKSAQETP